MENSLLNLKNLNIQRGGHEILSDVNLSIQSGTIHGLLGLNGSGKSSLAYALMGCSGYQPSNGRQAPKAAVLVVSANRVLAQNEIPGVSFEAEELSNGVRAKIKVDKNTIREALRNVMDPELNASVIDLNMIREIDISEEEEVTIHLVLTTPGCPLSGWISQQIYNEVMAVPEVKQVEVKILDEPWSPDNNWKSWLNNQI